MNLFSCFFMGHFTFKNAKNNLFFVFYLLVNPHLIKPLFCGLYLPVYIQYDWLKRFNINTVIDVGAYRGHVVKVMNYIFPNAKIYAFEPVAENINYINSHTTIPNLVLVSMAISSLIGKTTFYKNCHLPTSSLLKIDNKKNKNHSLSKYSEISVQTTTLDSYFHDIKLDEKIFLKIDVQGAEDMILKGGKELLAKVAIINIETTFNGLYKKEYPFSKIYDILQSRGFKYCGAISDSVFYPIFTPDCYSNSIFMSVKLNAGII